MLKIHSGVRFKYSCATTPYVSERDPKAALQLGNMSLNHGRAALDLALVEYCARKLKLNPKMFFLLQK